jgi:deoxyhypusine monooxygenase
METAQEFGKLLESEKISLTEKTTILWKLRSYEDKKESVKALQKGLVTDSALLKHEIAYVMGQIGDVSAIPILELLLNDTTQDCMVRHEAAGK